VGEVLEGRVGNIKPFGIFVDLPEFGARVSGLVPREETGEQRGSDLGRLFSIGEVVRVEILEVKDGKIRLAMAAGEAAQPERVVPSVMADAAGQAPAAAQDTPMAMAMRKALEQAQKKGGQA
jgi:small subunit ribosomal protein S1